MAYKYNEKTGEFEDVPMVEKKRKIPTLPDPPPPTTTHQPSRTSSSNSFLESLGGIIVGILPYAIGILFAATCS